MSIVLVGKLSDGLAGCCLQDTKILIATMDKKVKVFFILTCFNAVKIKKDGFMSRIKSLIFALTSCNQIDSQQCE